jgi:hypothetical protein
VTTLRYRSNVCVSALEVNECTMHRAGDSTGARWWLLWLRVNRDSDGQPDDFAVPVNPNGEWIEAGPGGRTWGLHRTSPVGSEPGVWQVAPSINVLEARAAYAGEHDVPSLWHQTPSIVDVPEGETWISKSP